MNGNHSIKSLLFDWDGTLVDSASLGLAAFEKTFGELGVVFAHDVYEAKYSPNWYSTYEALGLPKELWQTADDLWIRHYGEQSAPLIEGVDETLLGLRKKGYQLGVVTSGSRSRVCREVQQSVLKDAFAIVICNEDIVNKKPDPEGLMLAMRGLNVEASECAYVGDAPEDIEMGRRGNVLTVGVRSTYPSSARVLNSNPDLYLERITELVNHF
ncbi:MAG TPA: HAD family hydrolase [Pyrinomonadaceae bacterium]|jgi:HAD superfamily hydrolase (TIGR01509 family)|nr:HAD family hydrolase [Pyrinomonadaceae bacterium]